MARINKTGLPKSKRKRQTAKRVIKGLEIGIPSVFRTPTSGIDKMVINPQKRRKKKKVITF
jgi:hypothetical protein